MFLHKRLRRVAAFAAALALASSTLAAQENPKKKNKPQPTGVPVLWRAPDDLPLRDLFLGPGGEAMRPDLSRVTFLKDDNNRVLYVPGGGQGELRYVVSDLGATFGKTGNFITHSRNEPEKFAKTQFVEKVEGGKVRFDLSTKNSALFDGITVEHAAWIGGLLARLSDKQIEDAFRAANYAPEDVSLLSAALRERINQLKDIAGPATTEPAAAQGSPGK